MNVYFVFATGFFVSSTCLAGSHQVLLGRPSGSTGNVSLGATVSQTVSLRIEDSASGGGNLTSEAGIHFGAVNNVGTTDTPGVTGSAQGNVGHYEAEFTLHAERSGVGNVTLNCRRSGGNFNAKDGVQMDDANGVLRSLPMSSSSGVTVLEWVPSGSYDKTIAIRVYHNDKGTLKTTLQFTLCAL